MKKTMVMGKVLVSSDDNGDDNDQGGGQLAENVPETEADQNVEQPYMSSKEASNLQPSQPVQAAENPNYPEPLSVEYADVDLTRLQHLIHDPLDDLDVGDEYLDGMTYEEEGQEELDENVDVENEKIDEDDVFVDEVEIGADMEISD